MANPLTIVVQVEAASANTSIAGLNRKIDSIAAAMTGASKVASGGLNKIEQDAARVAINIKQSFSALGDLVKFSLGRGLLDGTRDAAQAALAVASHFEIAELGIAAFVQEGEDAKKVFTDLKQFALESPLEFTSILDASNQLLALGTAAKDLIPTLGSLSTAIFAVTGGQNVPEKLRDIIIALGQVKAAGALTGEEFRQLRNANIVTIEELARAFNVTTAEFRKAIVDRAVPASQAIQAILEITKDKFKRFENDIKTSSKVAFSNFKDALAQAADTALRDYLPKLVDGLNSLSRGIREFAVVVKDNKGTIEGAFKVLGGAAITAGILKLGGALVAVRFGWTALSGAIAANPIGASLVAVGAALAGMDAYANSLNEAEMAQIRQNQALLETNRVFALIKAGKSSEDILRIGLSVDQLRQAYESLNKQGYHFEQRLKSLPADAAKFKASISDPKTGFKLDHSAKDAEEAERKRKAAIKDSETYLEASQRKEVDGLRRVREEYLQQLKDAGNFAEAKANTERGFQNFLRAERDKEFKDVQKGLDAQLESYQKFYQDRAKQEFRYNDDTLELLQETQKSRLTNQIALEEQARDSQLRNLDAVATYTIQQKLAAEERRAQIEIEFQNKTLAMRTAMVDQELRYEQDKAKRQSYDAVQIEIEKLKEIEKEHLASLERRATIEALYAGGGTLNVEQEAALQRKLVDIRTAFAQFSAAQEANIRLAEAAKLNARLAALEADSAEEVARLRKEAEGSITAAREGAAVKSTQIIRDNNLRVFEGLKRGAEGVFDNTVSKAKSFGQAVGDAIKIPILAAFKEIVSTRVAMMLFQIFGGGPVALQGGQPVFGGGITSTGGGGNVLGRLLGLGGAGALGIGGGGGIGFPGAPGGTPGFTGPVGGGGGGVGATSIGAQLSQFGGGLKGILGQLGNIGRGGAVLGPGSNGGALAQGGVGGVAGGALLAGGGTLAFLGLQRGGLSGLGMTAAGGALIGAKFGGPLGALIGGGIGALAGTARLFIKGAEEKIVEKVRSAYGITISKQFARDPLMGIIKQQFGGSIDVGIRSQQVKDLIELYGMSTGQDAFGVNAASRPVARSFALSGGTFTQQQTFQNGVSIPLDRLAGGAAATNASAAPVVQGTIQLDAEATAAFFQGQAAQFVGNNPRAVQASVMTANRQNAGRREQAATMLQPSVLTS
jgi:tape measure domain-containing protein